MYCANNKCRRRISCWRFQAEVKGGEGLVRAYPGGARCEGYVRVPGEGATSSSKKRKPKREREQIAWTS